MAEEFTQKEMLKRILDKMDKIEEKINKTHTLAVNTNGKVKLHTKLIFGCIGAIGTLATWAISIFK